MNPRQELLNKKGNPLYVNRYLKLINVFKNYEGTGENHHILPKSIYVEYENNKDNLIKVPTRVHFILHFILFKMFIKANNQAYYKMTFAFNQMRRVSKTSLLYYKHREEIKQIISSNNKNRKHYHNTITKKNYTVILDKNDDFILPENCAWGQSRSIKRNNFHKEHALVRNIITKEVFYCTKEEFYNNNNYIDAKIGRKHTKLTKKKMSNNGIKNRIKYYNPKTEKVIFLNIDEKVPEGYIKGTSPKKKKDQSLKISKLKSYYNPKTNEHIRISGNPPEGYIKGRGSFNNKGNKNMRIYHSKSGKEIYSYSKPKGFYIGKYHKHKKVYNNKHKFVEELCDYELVERYGCSILKASKEKPIGYNKAYITRLNEKSKKYVGYYIK